MIVHETAVHFDRDLPHHGTVNGATRGPGEGEVCSPVAMWVEAIDILLERLKASGVSFKDILAVSGAGQVCNVSVTSQQVVTLDYISNMAPSTGHLKRAFCCKTSTLLDL